MRTKRIFLSDVHVGVGSKTNWYQEKYHWNNLQSVFQYIIKNGDTIKDLVLLGDFVDQWTELPECIYPDLNEIMKSDNNLKIFSKLKECLALVENVYYLNGNHDMYIKPDEIEKIAIKVDGNEKHIQWVQEYKSGKIWGEHGHRFSFFNAIDEVNDSTYHLPIGYFITRLVSLYGLNEINKRWPGDMTKTSADLPGSGDPGFNFRDAKWLLEVIESKESVTQAMIDDLLEKARTSEDILFTLPDNGKPISAKEVKEKYKDLFHQREQKYGKKEAYESLLVADAENSLKIFAEKIGPGTDCHIVVLGHTHSPVDTYEEPIFYGDNYVYCNSGFCCPCKPDLDSDKKFSTFIEIDSSPELDIIKVWKVTNGELSVLKEEKIKYKNG